MDEETPDAKRDALLQAFRTQNVDGLRIDDHIDWVHRMRAIIGGLPDEDVAGMLARVRLANNQNGISLEAFALEHGLTPAESLLLASISEGLSVPEHAERVGIKVNTARVHMQRTLEKTGARRQTDLLRLLFAR